MVQERKGLVFSKAKTKFCLSLHCNSDNGYLVVNKKEINNFKANNKDLNFPAQFWIESISNQFGAFDSREKSLKENFSIDYNVIDKSDILKTNQYLMVKNNI